LRLAIGHEKAPDPPNGLGATMAALEAGLAAYKRARADEATMEESGRRVIAAIAVEALRQALASLAAYRAQFAATTAQDMAAWHEALRLCGRALDRRALEGPRSPLRAIRLGGGEGNSIQDLRLTLAGWRFGELIGAGTLADRREASAWIRHALGRRDDGA
jgi:hypothetical protein